MNYDDETMKDLVGFEKEFQKLLKKYNSSIFLDGCFSKCAVHLYRTKKRIGGTFDISDKLQGQN